MSKFEAVHNSIIFLFKAKSTDSSKFGLDILRHQYEYNIFFKTLIYSLKFPSIELKVLYFTDLLFFFRLISSDVVILRKIEILVL